MSCEKIARSVSLLAKNVRTSFDAFRVLGKKYSKNVEVVDPQLRKNEEIVSALKLFEDSWTLAKEYLEDSTTLCHLNWFSKKLQDK